MFVLISIPLCSGSKPRSKPRPSENPFPRTSVVVSEQVLALWDIHCPGAGELGLGEIAWMKEPVAPDTTVL